MVSMELGFSCSAGRIQGFEPLLRCCLFLYIPYVFAFLINYRKRVTSVFLLVGLYADASIIMTYSFVYNFSVVEFNENTPHRLMRTCNGASVG